MQKWSWHVGVVLAILLLFTPLIGALPSHHLPTAKGQTATPYGEWSPLWSPTDERLAFFSDRGGTKKVWIVNPDGTQLAVPPMTDQYLPRQFAWLADGSGITFVTTPSQDNPDSSDLWVFDLSESNMFNITSDIDDGVHGYALSPDGIHALVITEDLFPFPPTWSQRIFVVSLKGSVVNIFDDSSQLDGFDEPIWSPDGSQVALRYGLSEIWVGTLEHFPEMRIETGYVVSAMVWNPINPQQIALGVRANNAPNRFLLLDLLTRDFMVLTEHIGTPTSFSWSSDGRFLAYQVDVEPNSSDLAILDLLDLTIRTFPIDGDETYPQWSPSNSKLAFIHVPADKSMQGRIWVLDIASQTTHPLVQ